MATELPGIDEIKVAGWLTEVVGAVPPLSFAPIGDGQSNLTYVVHDSAGGAWVLRRPPLGELTESAHNVVREYNIQAGLANHDVPVPQMIAVNENPDVCEEPLVLMEHVEGIVLSDRQAVEAVTPQIRRAAGLSIGSTLALVHAVDLNESGLSGLASHSPYAPRQIKRWLRQWNADKTHENPIVEDLAERLRNSAPEQREVRLVHGDYHLLNVILDPASGVVRAVLDWELATLGDPLADLGSVLAYWPQAGDDPVFDMFALTLAPGFPSRAEIVEAYVQASGRDVSDLPFWHALGYWKVAIIVEGVRRRRLDVPANGEAPALDQVDGLLERARQTAQEAGI